MLKKLSDEERCKDAFQLGDRLNVVTYGVTYASVADETGFSQKTLRNIASVARKIPKDRRDFRVSFRHHEVVACLDADRQTYYLTMAFANRISVNRLRELVRRAK